MVALLAMQLMRQAPLIRLNVDGVQREILVIAPTEPSIHPPLILAFHGHGGKVRWFDHQMDFEKYWPQAVVVYLQGLPTQGFYDPAGTKSGWAVPTPGNLGKDIRLTDAALDYCKKRFHTLPSSTFAVGHSNGGGFVYGLWALRSSEFAAFCPMCGGWQAVPDITAAKPALILIGSHDPIVPPQRQYAAARTLARLDGCDVASWAPFGVGVQKLKTGAGLPFQVDVYDGGHKPPADAGAMAVRFFQSVLAR